MRLKKLAVDSTKRVSKSLYSNKGHTSRVISIKLVNFILSITLGKNSLNFMIKYDPEILRVGEGFSLAVGVVWI